jgi:hypothetical protein
MTTENNKPQFVEAKLASGHSFPKISLPSEVKVWLEAAYSKVKKGKKIEPIELIVELGEKLPSDFDYENIDRRLFRLGREITLLGILHVDPTSDFVDKTDKVVTFIKELIRKDPGIKQVTALEVAKVTEIPKNEVAIVFNLLSHLGRFLSGASGDTSGYTSINIESEEVKREYLGYKGIDHLVNRFYKANEPKQETEIPMSVFPTSYVVEGNSGITAPTVSVDFSFIANSRIAEIVKRDYAELQLLDPNQTVKSVLVLSGGIIEGLLLDALVAAKHFTFEKDCQCYLKDMIYPAKKLGIIQHDNITDVLRIFRNIIHSAREIKDNLSYNASHAKHARASVHVIISEIRDWHSRRSTNP